MECSTRPTMAMAIGVRTTSERARFGPLRAVARWQLLPLTATSCWPAVIVRKRVGASTEVGVGHSWGQAPLRFTGTTQRSPLTIQDEPSSAGTVASPIRLIEMLAAGPQKA